MSLPKHPDDAKLIAKHVKFTKVFILVSYLISPIHILIRCWLGFCRMLSS